MSVSQETLDQAAEWAIFDGLFDRVSDLRVRVEDSVEEDMWPVLTDRVLESGKRMVMSVTPWGSWSTWEVNSNGTTNVLYSANQSDKTNEFLEEDFFWSYMVATDDTVCKIRCQRLDNEIDKTTEDTLIRNYLTMDRVIELANSCAVDLEDMLKRLSK